MNIENHKAQGVPARGAAISGIEDDELIVDNFAGGGGASTGIELALGRPVDIAINHDPEALAMHAANHPRTLHLCENVWKVDIAAVVAGRKVGLAWFSPDCKHFSKAKGGKPVEKKIRGLAWVALRWAGIVKPRVIMLENVEEFQTWGPLVGGKPCPRRKGQTFRRWVKQLQDLGYAVDWREMKACEFGAPTIRKRLFIVARRDMKVIPWPDATHGPTGNLFLQPYRTAADCIDWSLPCPSIFLTKEEARAIGVNRPLAEATMRRIGRGVKRYVIDSAEPFIVSINHGDSGGRREYGIDEPFTTATRYEGRALVSPLLAGLGGRMGQSPERSVEDPYHTVTAKADTALVTPFLQSLTHQGGDRSEGVEEPFRTITGAHRGEKALVTPFIAPIAHYNGSETVHPGDELLRTVTANPKGGAFALAVPTLIETGYGEREGQEPRVPGLDKPLGTVVGSGKHALVAGHITRFNQNGIGHGVDEPLDTAIAGAPRFGLCSAFLAKHYTGVVGSDLNDPVATVTASDHNSLVTAFVSRQFGKSVGHSVDEPAGTVTGGGGGKSALVASSLVKLRGTCQDGQPVDEPMATVSVGGTHIAEVRAFLLSYYSTDQDARLEEPAPTLTTKHRLGIVTVHGIDYQIVDIGMRMLCPRELFRAQGFPDSYIIERGRDPQTGAEVKLTKTAQVRMCGNSVSPPPAEALVRAQFGITAAAVAA
jgi:DNA (cytosine-5)-methyltransferase 1